MRKQLIAAACTIVAAASTAANAQDNKHFDGLFIGIDAGYLAADGGVDGAVANLIAGYRVQTDDNLVFGIEGTYGGADIDFIDNQWTVNGSVGWAYGADNRNLFSVGGGYVQVNASAFGFNATGDGYTAFTSYERAFNDYWSFRLKGTTYEFDTFIGTAGIAFRF